MTPEEFEKIALWMRWHPQGITAYEGQHHLVWCDDLGQTRGTNGNTALAFSECIEALERMVERGYRPNLIYNPLAKKWSLDVYQVAIGCEKVGFAWQPTIHEAIEAAILQLVGVERGEGVGDEA